MHASHSYPGFRVLGFSILALRFRVHASHSYPGLKKLGLGLWGFYRNIFGLELMEKCIGLGAYRNR